MRAGGKIIREVISQLKKNGYVENYANREQQTFGLLITKTGRSEMDKVATRVARL